MLLKLINNSLRKYFDSDPEVASQLQELEGKHLLLKLTDIKQKFLITPTNSSINVTEYHNDKKVTEITTIIETNLITLLQLALGSDYQSLLKTGAIHIDGNAELANQVRTIFMSVDIDWEEVASKYVGDTVAYQLGIFGRRVKNYKQRSAENFRLDVSEYLQEESRIVPTKIEIEHYLNAVDALDADIERLEARVSRIMGKTK